MPLSDLVAPQAVIPALKVNNKKQALQEIAARAADLSGLSEREILEIVQQREKLGSTGIGNGIAIPHGKLMKLGRLFGLFARLDRPIDFESLDGQPVDLIFLLLAPEAAGADHPCDFTSVYLLAAGLVEDCAAVASQASAELERMARAAQQEPIPGQDSLL